MCVKDAGSSDEESRETGAALMGRKYGVEREKIGGYRFGRLQLYHHY